MAQDQRAHRRIAFLADADLQRAAVLHQPCRMNADRVFGEPDRLLRRGEQGKFRRRRIEHVAEFGCRQIARSRHEGQFAIDLSHRDEFGAAFGARCEQIERDVGIAAQTITRLTVQHSLGY